MLHLLTKAAMDHVPELAVQPAKKNDSLLALALLSLTPATP
jgi:hypothetical protein